METPEIKECKKSKYISERFALADISRIKKTSKRSKVPTRAYFCNICNFWHLTSQSDKKEDFKKEKMLALENQVKSLKLEIETLKKLSSKENKELNKQIKTDQRVKELNERLVKLNKAFKQQREDNHTLISKNIQLQNKIDELTKKTGIENETGTSNNNGG
jgi:hypothetical protein